jgi:hypothetical protein
MLRGAVCSHGRARRLRGAPHPPSRPAHRPCTARAASRPAPPLRPASRAAHPPSQRETGAIASALERGRHALSWADPNLTFLLSVALAAAGAAASLALLVAGPLLAAVPPRWVLAALVGPALLPPAMRERMRVEDNPVLGPLLRDVHLALGIAWPADEPSAGDGDDDDDAGFIHIFGGGGGGGGGADTAGDEARLGAVGRAVLAARRVYGHVPDGLDAAHRVIAARQLRRRSAAAAAAAPSPVPPPSLTATTAAAAPGKRGGPLVLGRPGAAAAAAAAAAAESGDQLEREVAAELAGTAPRLPPAEAAAAATRMSVRELRAEVERCGGTCDGMTDKEELVQVNLMKAAEMLPWFDHGWFSYTGQGRSGAGRRMGWESGLFGPGGAETSSIQGCRSGLESAEHRFRPTVHRPEIGAETFFRSFRDRSEIGPRSVEQA